MLESYLDRLPLVAILRGVTAGEVVAIGEALVNAGFAIIEVPLNSPSPLSSIRKLHEAFGHTTLIGAGTVRTGTEVLEVKNAGGELIVMPHCDPVVIREARSRRMICIPGIATPSEGFAALASGADALKLFPAELVTPAVLKAMRSVFPPETKMLPVGGITPDNMGEYVTAGASGFGLGSALYRAGDGQATVAAKAKAFVDAWRSLGAATGADPSTRSARSG